MVKGFRRNKAKPRTHLGFAFFVLMEIDLRLNALSTYCRVSRMLS